MISVDLNFTAKQILANDENILRKIFYVKTKGALNLHKNLDWQMQNAYTCESL